MSTILQADWQAASGKGLSAGLKEVHALDSVGGVSWAELPHDRIIIRLNKNSMYVCQLFRNLST